MGQNQHLYERTGDQGPVTTGAAGTDRFDSTGTTGTTGASSGDVGYAGVGQQEATQRAEGKSSGGVAGIVSPIISIVADE